MTEEHESQQKAASELHWGAPRANTNAKNTARLFRTMKSDEQDAIRNQNETLASIAIAEEKKRKLAQMEAAAAQRVKEESLPPPPKPLTRFALVLMIALLAILLSLAYVFVLPKLDALRLPTISMPSFRAAPPATSTTPVIQPLAASIIPAQTEKRLSITNQPWTQTLSAIMLEKEKIGAPGSIENIYLTEIQRDAERPISTNQLLAFAGIAAPIMLTRSLEDSFMLGLYSEEDGTSTPFLIMKVSDSDMGVAGMLAWEQSLPHVIDVLFGTTIEREVPSSVTFRDTITLNKDARILATDTGTAVVYAFANPTTIFIAKSSTTLEALLSLAAKK